MTTAAPIRAGIRFTLASTVVSGLIQFGAMMVLARLLLPDDYGAYAIAIVVNAISAGFVLQCFDRAEFLVAQPDGPAAENLLIPACLAVIAALALTMAVGAELVAPIDLPLPAISIAMAASVLSALLVRTRVYFRRTYRFGTLAIMEVTAQVVGPVCVAIALAHIGFGAEGILLGQLAGVATSSAICLYSAKGQIRFTCDVIDLARSAQGAIRIGRIIGLEIAHAQIPTSILATTFGQAQLGLFNRAFALVHLPVQLLTASVSRVTLSATRDAVGNKHRLAATTADQVTMVAAALSPIVGGMIGCGPQFIHAVLGHSFLGAIPLVMPLALVAWSHALGSVLGTAAEGMGLVDLKIRVQIASSMVLVVLLGFGALHSIEASAMAMALSSPFFLFAYGRAVTQHLGKPKLDMLAWLLPGLGSGVLACFLSAVVGLVLPGPPWSVLGAQVLACGLGVTLYYKALYPDIAREALLLLRRA